MYFQDNEDYENVKNMLKTFFRMGASQETPFNFQVIAFYDKKALDVEKYVYSIKYHSIDKLKTDYDGTYSSHYPERENSLAQHVLNPPSRRTPNAYGTQSSNYGFTPENSSKGSW